MGVTGQRGWNLLQALGACVHPNHPCFAAFLPLQGCRQPLVCQQAGLPVLLLIWGSPAHCTWQVTLLGRQHQHKQDPSACIITAPPAQGRGVLSHTCPCPWPHYGYRDEDRPLATSDPVPLLTP